MQICIKYIQEWKRSWLLLKTIWIFFNHYREPVRDTQLKQGTFITIKLNSTAKSNFRIYIFNALNIKCPMKLYFKQFQYLLSSCLKLVCFTPECSSNWIKSLFGTFHHYNKFSQQRIWSHFLACLGKKKNVIYLKQRVDHQYTTQTTLWYLTCKAIMPRSIFSSTLTFGCKEIFSTFIWLLALSNYEVTLHRADTQTSVYVWF